MIGKRLKERPDETFIVHNYFRLFAWHTITNNLAYLCKLDKNVRLRVNMAELEVGDYLVTTNGFYLKCLNINPLDDKIFITFPNGIICVTPRSINQRQVLYKGRIRSHKDKITSRQVLFCQLIAQGISPSAAYNTVAKKRDVTVEYRWLTDPKVIRYLITETTMADTLRDELAKRGIDRAKLAEKIADYIEDDRSPIQLKKWALETAIKSYEGSMDVVQVEHTVVAQLQSSSIEEAFMTQVAEHSKNILGKATYSVEEKKEPNNN